MIRTLGDRHTDVALALLDEQQTLGDLHGDMGLSCSVCPATHKMLSPLHFAAAFEYTGYEINGGNSCYNALAKGVHGVITYYSKCCFESRLIDKQACSDPRACG